MKRIIIITGTPGTGKTTIAEKLCRKLNNSELLRSNSLIKEFGLYKYRTKDGELVADMERLRNELERKARKSAADTVIIEGHLLCDIRIKGATAIVIREHLRKLQKRMIARHYKESKINNNIVAEAVDYCGINAEKNYEKVYEIIGGDNAVENIIGILEGRQKPLKQIELLDELNHFIKTPKQKKIKKRYASVALRQSY
jgi:adenylate kinase